MRRLIASLVSAAGLMALALPAGAQPAPAAPQQLPAFVQVRGTVQSLAGNVLTVNQAAGPAVVTLADTWTLTVLKKIDVGSIQPGSFIGTTNVDKPDGTGQSTEVHVFPPGQRGGEGHYPMPGQTAMMTNGDVTNVVASASGQQLDIKYNGRGGAGVRHVVVPPGTPVVMFTQGDKAMVKPGISVSLYAAKAADGSLSAQRLTTGENGSAPPI